MNFVSLFSGIGGFDKPLEDVGHICVAQSEFDPYSRKPDGEQPSQLVLKKHFLK